MNRREQLQRDAHWVDADTLANAVAAEKRDVAAVQRPLAPDPPGRRLREGLR